MKISIVVPVYNAEKYLAECVESVLKQTNDNWELFLVDDGSTDKSSEMCDNFASIYSDKIFAFHKANEGQFLTRQYGIKKCTGEYIGFLDADDFLNIEYVDSILKCIQENNDLQVVCFGFEDDCGKVVVPEKNQIFSTLRERQDVYTQIINGELTGALWSKVFSKELLYSVCLDKATVSQKKYGEDAFQSFGIMAKAESIAYLNKSLYFYRSNPQGASQGFDSRPLDYFNTKYVFELIEQSLPDWCMDTEEYKKQLCARNFNETVYYMLKFYRTATNRNRRHRVVEYDWTSYLLKETLHNVEDNEYVRQSYLKVWKLFENKAYTQIYLREKFKKVIGW